MMMAPGFPGTSTRTCSHRLERSRNRDTGGAGLALAFARTVACEHGGDFKLYNVDGGGLRAAGITGFEARSPKDRVWSFGNGTGE
jgi:signal transduction histidine kinase